MLKRVPILLLLLAAVPLPAAAPADVMALHGVIVPRLEDEPWMQVPWLSDLWTARRRASEEGKPIFLWEMDGHPLGCT